MAGFYPETNVEKRRVTIENHETNDGFSSLEKP